MANTDANRIDDVGESPLELSRALAPAIAHPVSVYDCVEGAILPINRMRAESLSRTDSRRLVDDLLQESIAS
jgi:hypothetical protein